MTTPESTTHWYLMTHLEMKRFKEWLLAENVKRLDQGEPVVEPFFPSDFIVETALSKEIIRGEAGDGDTIKMGYDGNEFMFEKE